LNDQVKGAVAAEQKIREGLHQKNAGTNQDDQLDAGSDESAPIEVVAARAERRRHNGSVRRGAQWRQSASSTYVCFVDVRLPLLRQGGLPLQRLAGRRAGRRRAG
jgi:hypothetical protein